MCSLGFMSAPIPTPYDGSSKLFQIGLKPLDPAEWIDVDEHLPAYLAEKERIGAARPEEVFAAEPGRETAQAEVLALLAAHLPQRFPDVYRRAGNEIEIVPANRRVALDAPGLAPLQIAAGLVQEDLVLLRKGEAGWRLAAASLCFPSSWALREKFGRPMHAIHAPVPGFGEGTRNAQLIERMFDHLRPEMPVLRWNWSLYGDDALFHPESAYPAARRASAPASGRRASSCGSSGRPCSGCPQAATSFSPSASMSIRWRRWSSSPRPAGSPRRWSRSFSPSRLSSSTTRG
jgi:hypothetical protein